MAKNDFDLIDKEVERQFLLTFDVDKSLDTKAIFILGFISVGLSILVKINSSTSLWILLSGFWFLMAGLFAMGGFWIRHFHLGPKPENLVSLYKKNYKYLNQLIAKEKWLASKVNQEKIKSKAKFIKVSLIMLFFAIVSLTIGLVI